MITPSDLLAAAQQVINSATRFPYHPDLFTLKVIADMAEELGYTDEIVLDHLRNPTWPIDNLHWWALRLVKEHFEKELQCQR